MTRRYANVAVTITSLVGLILSFFLMVQHTLPPALGACPVNGGCHIVRACRIGSLSMGLWPIAGIFGFLVVFVMSLSTRGAARRALPIVALAGGLIGASLIVVQKAVCGAFCIYCIFTDTSAVLMALAAWMGRGEQVELTWRRRGAFAGLAAAAIIGSLIWRTGFADRPAKAAHADKLPATVESEQRAGQVTIVMFMSVNCRYCRAQHVDLLEAMAPYAGKVRLVSKFPFRDPADEAGSLSALCADTMGQGAAMLTEMLKSPSLTRSDCEAIAGKIGLDLAAFKSCLDAPETSARLAEHGAAVRDAALAWVPTTFVGHDRFDGNAPAADIRASIENELREMAPKNPVTKADVAPPAAAPAH